MKMLIHSLTATLGVAVLAGMFPSMATAGCGDGLGSPRVHPSSWHPQYGQPRLLRAALGAPADQDDEDADRASIVGFWHFKFVVGGKTVDAGFQQWHSDGTEITNSGGHPPNTSNFCLGVWEKVGTRQYRLSHFALPWNPTLGDVYPGTNIPMGQPVGTVHIEGRVTLAPDGQSFSGTFTSTFYDESGNEVPSLYQEGTFTGTRINVNTSFAEIPN